MRTCLNQFTLQKCVKSMILLCKKSPARSTAAFLSSTSRQRDTPASPPLPLAFLDVPYYKGDGACDEKHRLDIYIPSAPFPRPRSRACLFVHGGSWQRGSRRLSSINDELYGNVGRAFARAGMVALVMSYRLAPDFQHPEQVRDVARAIRWARGNVWRYGGDRDDLVLVGHSAGAHLAALCLADARWMEEEGVFLRAGPREAYSFAGEPPPTRVVSGFVGISGVYDVLRLGGNMVGAALAAAAFGDDRRSWEGASPLHRVRAATVAARRSAATPSVINTTPRAMVTTGGNSSPELASDSAHDDRETADIICGHGRKSELDTVGHLTASICPLVYTDVLLLTASSDFHLKEDAEALVKALDEARRLIGRTSKSKEESTGSTGDAARRVGSQGPPRVGHGKYRSHVWKAGNEGVGSAQDVCLESEDHLSTMISFGEPGKEASDAVLDFIVGLPSPRKKE